MGRRLFAAINRSGLLGSTPSSTRTSQEDPYHYPSKVTAEAFKALRSIGDDDFPEETESDSSDLLLEPPERPAMPRPSVFNRRCVSMSAADDAREEDGSDERIRTESCPGRKVSFHQLEIRSYEVVMGDHPYCSQGCSVSLGWEYTLQQQTNVSEYEAKRPPRRSMHELRLSPAERNDLLSDQHNACELRRASRKLHRARSCVARMERRVNETFFNGGD